MSTEGSKNEIKFQIPDETYKVLSIEGFQIYTIFQ